MKKSLLFITIVIALNLFTGCSKGDDKQTDIRYGLYEVSLDSEVLCPSIELSENNEFIFNYSFLSSYKPMGTYVVKDNILTLSTSDNKNVYIFEIVDNKLVFNEEESSKIPVYSHQYKLKDKDEFIFVESEAQ